MHRHEPRQACYRRIAGVCAAVPLHAASGITGESFTFNHLSLDCDHKLTVAIMLETPEKQHIPIQEALMNRISQTELHGMHVEAAVRPHLNQVQQLQIIC